MFKRSTLHYGQSPEPVTPYQKAGQVWDERIGSARAQARNWRLMALGTLAVSAAVSGALIWRSLQADIIPYVVEVGEFGEVRALGPASEAYVPGDAQIAHHLASFIANVRSLSIDPVIVRENWLKAYDFATAQAAVTLSQYAQENDPFAHIGKRSRTTDVVSVVRVSPESFQARWLEKTYDNGVLTDTRRFTGLFSILLDAPRDAETLRANPLGLYISSLNWGEDLVTGD